MPDTEICQVCKGTGSYEALVSQHDDKKEKTKCTACGGNGVIHWMTEEDESDYHDNYW